MFETNSITAPTLLNVKPIRLQNQSVRLNYEPIDLELCIRYGALFHVLQAISRSLGMRAATALGVSIIADALDYVAAPLFSMPLIGDIPDAIVTAILFSITRSKRSTLVNAVEFIPIIGDFVPTYTLSTLLWIYGESKKRRGIVRL